MCQLLFKSFEYISEKIEALILYRVYPIAGNAIWIIIFQKVINGLEYRKQNGLRMQTWVDLNKFLKNRKNIFKS